MLRAREVDTREYPARCPRLERYLKIRSCRGQCFWRREERKLRYSLDLIEPQIAQHHPVIADERRARLPACFAVLAPHLEQVREVGCETVGQPQTQGAIAEIAYHQLLVACTVPYELHAVQMDVFPPQRDRAVLEQIGIAEVGGEHGVVVLRRRGEQQRLCFLQKQLQLRERSEE